MSNKFTFDFDFKPFLIHLFSSRNIIYNLFIYYLPFQLEEV